MEKITYRVLSRLYRTEKCGFEEIQQITGKNESISPSNYIAALMAAGYIRNWSSSEKMINDFDYKPLGYEITLDGRAYVENHRRNIAQFWIPYLLTTMIAVASLIVSIAQLWGRNP